MNSFMFSTGVTRQISNSQFMFKLSPQNSYVTSLFAARDLSAVQ